MAISITHLKKSFDQGRSFVVDDISLDVHDGETLVLLGSSGCGKTTTLKMINRLIEPSSGKIEIDGKNIIEFDKVKLRRSIGYVFQSVGLFPHMTVEENISIVLRLDKRSKKEQRHRAAELLKTVNLDPKKFAKRFPHELSGGQNQRVGVARALASKPKYLLMDEPFAALDAINREDLQSELISLRERVGVTIVFVTHDILEAIRLGDHIAVMNKGKIEQIGTSQALINHPKTDFISDLFSHTVKQLDQD